MTAITRSDPVDAVLDEILAAYEAREPGILVDSPPGAGKTGLVERLAAYSYGVLRERCAVSANTNEQAFDLARRIATHYRGVRVHLLVRQGLTVPTGIAGLTNVEVVRDARRLPTGRCVVVANARKWAWVSATGFDSLVVDEAYQMADVDFIQVARLAGRFVQVGDPGQINPFQEAPIERWRCDPAGPHVPAPEALLARRGEEALARFGLPVSRRLLPDTVAVVQPSFYPTLPFRAMAAPGERHLAFAVAAGDDLDGALDRCADGRASLALVELPPLLTNEDDPALAAALAEAVWRIVARGAAVRDGGRRWAVRPDDIGVVCAHTSQVNAVRERLDPALAAVMVDTANRWQGLERPLMLVHHPLSGRSDASEFHLEAGRLCVMASRHRVACWIFAREGVERTLEDHVPTGDRALGIDHDPEHEGRRAHLTFMRLMRTPGRTAPLTG